MDSLWYSAETASSGVSGDQAVAIWPRVDVFMYIKDAATGNLGVQICTGEYGDGLRVDIFMYIKDSATDYVEVQVCTGGYGGRPRVSAFMDIKEMARWMAWNSKRISCGTQRRRLLVGVSGDRAVAIRPRVDVYMYIKDSATSNLGVDVCTGEYAGGLRVGALMYINEMARRRTCGRQRKTCGSRRRTCGRQRKTCGRQRKTCGSQMRTAGTQRGRLLVEVVGACRSWRSVAGDCVYVRKGCDGLWGVGVFMHIKDSATSNLGVDVCTGGYGGRSWVDVFMYIKAAARGQAEKVRGVVWIVSSGVEMGGSLCGS